MNNSATPQYTALASAIPAELANGWKFSLFFFVLGVISGFTVDVGGKLYLGEFFGISCFFLRLIKKGRLSPIPLKLIVLAFFWSLSQVFSDIVNSTEVLDSVKGVLSPLVFIACISGLASFFIANLNRFPSYLIGLPLGLLVDVVSLNPTVYFLANNQWKWGYGSSISKFAVVLLSFFVFRSSNQSFNYQSFFVFSGLAFVGLANDSRGSISILIIYCLFVFQRLGFAQRFLAFLLRLKAVGIWILIMGVALSVFISSFGLGFIILNPMVASIMPDATYIKTVKQAQSSFGLLLGGRSEILASFEAFADKPLLGHGSWAKDNSGVYNALRIQRAFDLGEDIDLTILDRVHMDDVRLIPTHSFIMGGFVWAGIAGGLFWIYMLYWLANVYVRHAHDLNFYYFIGIYEFVWGILFSPFAYSTRFSSAVFVASLIAYTVFLSRVRSCLQSSVNDKRKLE